MIWVVSANSTKEPSCPSLCAFCAHRLGQVRKPSHVQRRFLQSSRPVSNPPAEAIALREEEESKSPQPTWGRPGTVGGNGGPAATWGRQAGGIPSRPTATWGSPLAGGNSIPSAASVSGGVPPRPVGTWSNSVSGDSMSASSVGFAQPKSTDGILDPYEAAARNRMLAQQAKAQQRPVQKPLGPGPETNRAGRPEPRTRHEMMNSAKHQLAGRNQYDSFAGTDRKYKNTGSTTGPRITRHIMGDRELGHRSETTESKDYDNSRWGQLRRTTDTPSNEFAKRRVNSFVESRAEREEEAKSGGYRPLSTRSFKPIFDRDASRSDSPRQQERPTSWAQGMGARMVDLSKKMPSKSSMLNPPHINYASAVQQKHDPELGGSWADPSTMTGSLFSASSSKTKLAFSKGEQQKKEEEEEEREEREARRKKKTRRGGSDQMTYDNLPKGKDRDKVKRRQQFSRNEEDDAEADAAAARAEAKRQKKLERAAQKAAQAAAPTPILLPEYISVSNLAVALKVRLEEFVRKMEELGFEETGHDYILNAENAGLIAQEYNYEAIIERGESEDLRAREPAPDPSVLPPRPPVVTIMGHVDHGKTTLLDYLRKSSVAASEHGGITQHIGAFSVPMPSGKVITFLDTPGHAAFLSMRQRGANVTDIVILVVAADDSVKPQTIEAINHAKAAKVPIIVAINKIDKEQANIDRVKQDLARHGVDVEDFGGDTQVVCVSGKTGQGMSELEEAAVTLSEILDMRAETDGQAEGWVLEASIKSMGKVATVLVRRGTMRPGDFIVAGKTWARIRCLRNEAGVEIEEAGPGMPVEIDGWREQPLAGDEVLQAPDESKAKSVVGFRLEKGERDKMAEDMEAINENRKAEQEKREREKAQALAEAEAKAADEELPEKARSSKPSGPKEVFFVVKGDVSGSVEAVVDSISALGTKEVRPSILRSGVGQVSEFDIEHAAAANGFVINFNTEIEPNIARIAADSKVGILDHNIIYRLVDEVKVELSKHLPPLVTQRVLGEAEIAQIFSITVKGRQQKSIAGCKVRNGTVSKTAKVRVLRGGEKVYEGTYLNPASSLALLT
jgi:translation initiation factor IF-2